MPYQNFNPGMAQWTLQALGRLALSFGVVVGILILAGGEERFGGRSFASALTYPGSPYSWGAVALAAGLTGIVCSVLGWFQYVWWALMTLAIWAGFFALSFANTAIDDPMASTTGVAVYGHIALSCLVLGIAHRITGKD